MSTLVTLVGKQPAAVATTVKTLIKKANLKHIILLYTQGTQDEHTRLTGYIETIKRDFNGLKIESSVIETDLANPSGYPFAWNIILEKIKNGQLPEPVYYDTSPGLNYQVALISYHLQTVEKIIPLYADYKNLYNLNTSESWQLENIGFQELLDLYGLKSDKYPSSSHDIVEEVTISGGAFPLTLLGACEKSGRLYGLYKIWRNHSLRDQEKEKKRLKQEARKIEAILESPAFLNHLQPRIIVWTNYTPGAHRLRAYGIQTLNENTPFDNIIREWKEKLDQPPGSFLPGGGETTVERKEVLQNPEGKWRGKNLILALGTDPSATLLAIFTHQPEELVILFDKDSAWIKAIAGRIKQSVMKIPAKRITFWPMGLLGNIEEVEKLKSLLRSGGWIVNITPGTKSQTWKLARLNNVEIWSLNTQKRAATRLTSIENHFDIQPFSFPPISLQACINGGILRDEGLADKEVRDQIPFFTTVVDLIAKEAQRHPRGGVKFDLPWAQGKRFPKNGDRYIKCKELDNDKIIFEIPNGQAVTSGIIRCDDPNDPGKWLEEPVAAAFILAAGSEIKEMRLGVKWNWLNNKQVGNHFRTELDIILQWNGHFIGISCKRSGGLEEDLENYRNEIMAEARAGLGRFAIPILVRGNIPYKQAMSVAKESLKDGPLEIGLCLLNQTDVLKRLVKMAMDKYHTLSQTV